MLALPLCCSCESMFEHEFTPHGLKDKKPKLFIQTIMDAGKDRVRIDAGIATPNFGHAVIPDDARISLEIKVNGAVVAAVEDKEEALIHQQCFYIDGPMGPSDMVEIRATSPGLASASCRTVIPSALPAVAIESAHVLTDKTEFGYWMDQVESDCTRFRIRIDEKPVKGRFYGVQVWRESAEDTGYDTLYTMEQGDIPMSGRKYDICGTYEDADIQVFDSSCNVDGKISFDVFVKHVSSKVSPRYKIIVSRLTPDFYHSIEKLKSLDGLWSLAVGPHAYFYSNIDGGLGMIGAKSNYVSDWIYTEK